MTQPNERFVYWTGLRLQPESSIDSEVNSTLWSRANLTGRQGARPTNASFQLMFLLWRQKTQAGRLARLSFHRKND